MTIAGVRKVSMHWVRAFGCACQLGQRQLSVSFVCQCVLNLLERVLTSHGSRTCLCLTSFAFVQEASNLRSRGRSDRQCDRVPIGLVRTGMLHELACLAMAVLVQFCWCCIGLILDW